MIWNEHIRSNCQGFPIFFLFLLGSSSTTSSSATRGRTQSRGRLAAVSQCMINAYQDRLTFTVHLVIKPVFNVHMLFFG